MSTAPFKRILAPVDLSSCSRGALELAYKLGASLGASVDVLFVHTPEAGSAAVRELGAAREELHRFVQSVTAAQPAKITEHVEAGDARERIVAIAEASKYDVIILGTHGRTGRARSLGGSVAETVVRTASCPVITVREPR